MVVGVFDELARERPRQHFTIGIDDDVSHTSLGYDPAFDIESTETMRAVFFGVGSDGTVGANKNTIKILGAEPDLHAQGYFVYDSKKSGSQTVSHLRFGPHPIRAPYLVAQAGFVGCHHWRFLEKADVLGRAAPGAALGAQHPARPRDGLGCAAYKGAAADPRQKHRVVRHRRRSDRPRGRPGRADQRRAANLLLRRLRRAAARRAVSKIKDAVAKTYANLGADVVTREVAAVDRAVDGLHRVDLPDHVTSSSAPAPIVPADAPQFVRTVTAEMIAGRGDRLPVSALPADGTYPSGTAAYEKRNISELVAVWDPSTCIQCGNCGFVCPHSVIRTKLYESDRLDGAPRSFASAPLNAVGLPESRYTCRCTPRTAPAAACAWRPVLPWCPVPRSPRRSICAPREPLRGRAAREHRVLRGFAR